MMTLPETSRTIRRKRVTKLEWLPVGSGNWIQNQSEKMKVSLFVITLLLVFQGCEFPLEDENYVEISDVPKNEIAIALQDLPDTVEVFTNMVISYSLEVEGYPAIAVFAVVGDQVQYLGYDYNGTFTLSNATNQITTTGYLPFELVVLSTSRTGSLADRSQRELVLFSRSESSL